MGLRTLAAAMAATLIAGSATAADWKVTTLVPGGPFHGVHGIRMGPDGLLYAGSVSGSSLWSVDPKTGKYKVVIGPPEGQADDLGFGPGGQMVWTAIGQGIVYSRKGNGPIEQIARLPSINSIHWSPDGKRLFAAQVFGADDLWELDPTGKTPPRRIRAQMGGFNSFAMGSDGKLYGPLWFRGQVVQVDPDSGETKVIAEGLKTPAAVKLDAAQNIYALDTAVGQMLAIGRDGSKRLVAQLEPALDNFEIVGGKAYVTNMVDDGIQEVDLKSGKVRQVVKGAFSYPLDIAISSDGGRETIWVADAFAFRKVDARTGKVSVVERQYAAGSHVGNSSGVGVGKDRVLVTGGGSITTWDRKTGAYRETLRGGMGVTDAVELPDGTIVAAERARGRLIKFVGETRDALAEGLAGPSSLAVGKDGQLYVTEVGAGRVSRVDGKSGQRTTVAEGFQLPRAVAAGPDGKLVVLDVGAKEAVAVDPGTGAKTVLARNLPVGWITKPVPNGGGVAVGADGTVYVSSDVDNSLLKLTPR